MCINLNSQFGCVVHQIVSKVKIFADTLSREPLENRANSKDLGSRTHQAEERFDVRLKRGAASATTGLSQQL